jgi:hypothetical protein
MNLERPETGSWRTSHALELPHSHNSRTAASKCTGVHAGDMQLEVWPHVERGSGCLTQGNSRSQNNEPSVTESSSRS